MPHLKLQTSGLHYLVEMVNEWKKREHVNHEGDIVFQNKKLLANIKFSDNSMHVILKNWQGFERLPDTLKNPDEVWSRWLDKKQLQVQRIYINFDKVSYIVITKNGMVDNAYLVKDANRFRKGLLIFKK